MHSGGGWVILRLGLRPEVPATEAQNLKIPQSGYESAH